MPEENKELDNSIKDIDTSADESINDLDGAAGEELSSDARNIHDKASGMRDAYSKTLTNKDYYKNAKENNKNRLEEAKNKKEELQKKVDQDKENKRQNKNNLDNKNKEKDKDAKEKLHTRKTGGLFSKKNRDPEEKKENDPKENKKELKEAKKEEKAAEKEAKDLKRDELKSKIYKATHPLEAAKMKAEANIKEVAKGIWKKIPLKVKIIIIGIFVAFITIALLIMICWSYIEGALAKLDEGATNVANAHEKVDNFLNGLGFQNSEEAFYDELNKLNKKHDYQINIPILMATLFYDETHSNGDVGFETGGDDGEESGVAMALARRWVREKVKESNETIGADGLTYSSNKIYRLRKLVRNQFDNPIFGKGTNKIEHSVSPLEYLELIKENIDTALYDHLKELFLDLTNVLNISNNAESLYQWLIEGDETFFTTDSGAHIESTWNSFLDLLDAIFSPFFDISSVSLCKESIVCVNYYTYGYDEEAYTNYLKEYYIRYMPEFKKYINASTDEIKDKEIDKVIAEIKETAENYEDVFGVQKTSTENYTETCVGNIKQTLVGDLEQPVKASKTVSFTGNYSYGTVSGKSHTGVDLNENTAGVKEGDSVYSVYSDGKVLESTADKTYKDKNVKGGWVKIQYGDTSGKEAYQFTIIYGGLSNSSLKLKKGDSVGKGQEIGKIGNKDESEDGTTPGLHFGFYDDTSKIYMNPTNIFVACSSGGTSCKNYKVHDVYSISSTNFVAAVNKYCESNSCDSIKSHWNLTAVYNYSVNANLNPTFTVSRAFVEGFSPGSSKNNYWGIGCYNGCSSCCTSYGSMEAGVQGLSNLNIVKNADVMFDIFSSGYASLGTTWLNPGNWADGGCIYLPYIKEFLSDSDYSHASSACSPGVSGVKITQAEHDAYYEYQCKKTFDVYKAIFGDYITISNADAGPNANSSGGSDNSGSGSSKVEKYLAKMTEMANDSKIGYSQTTRFLNPNVDCASFIYYALLNSGVIGDEGYAFDCSAMGGVLKANGFKEYSYDASILKRGDIVVDPQHHATTYYGDGKQIAAHSNYSGGDGDPDDNEVNISTYSDSYHNYQYIYRLE